MIKRILLIADVSNWAWGIKARYIKKYLSDEFFIDITYLDKDKEIHLNYDLFFSFSPYLLNSIKEKKVRKITGVTGVSCYRTYFHMKRDFRKEVCALHANNPFFYKKIEGKHDKIYYLPNGVDTTLFIPQCKDIDKTNLVVGYVGKIRRSKGYEKYIKPIVASCKNVELMSNTNYYTRAVPHEEMPNFYRNIDVYVVAADVEGTPNPALEAAACGKPIISTRVGNMPEFIKNGVNGFLVKRDINTYIKKLTILRNDRNLLKRMGEEARKTAEQWDWKVKAESYRKMFRELLK